MHDPYLTSVCLHMLDLKEIVHTKSKGTDSKKKNDRTSKLVHKLLCRNYRARRANLNYLTVNRGYKLCTLYNDLCIVCLLFSIFKRHINRSARSYLP